MMIDGSRKTLFIVGPTASGKTRRAVDAAVALDGEIVSADSRQLYRGMDIGTGKDLDEYPAGVAYHLIDICEAGYKYNLYEYLRDASRAIADIRARHHTPIVCGGTGLYVESLLKGISLPEVGENPELRARLAGKTLGELTDILASMKTLHNVTDVDTCQRAIRAIEIQTYYAEHPDEAESVRPRPMTDAIVVGVAIPVEARRSRIRRRLEARLEEGLVEEVERLLQSGVAPDDLIYYGLEYKFVTNHILGRLSRTEMTEQLYIAICQFAKRQMTWFRGMERRGFPIHWLDYDLPAEEFTTEVRKLVEYSRAE